MQLKKKKKFQRLQKPDNKLRYVKEVAELLPSPISGIKVQKKNAFRFSIYIQDQFLIGVSDSTLTTFSISKNLVLTRKMLDDIIQKESIWAIREYFIRLLGRRDHARNELRDKARIKDFPSNFVEDVLDELTEKRYINNQAFAKKFVHDKFEFNKWGINKIRSELYRKGIPERDIQIALQEIDTNDQIEAIKNLIAKNRRKFERVEFSKRKKKIFDFLLRKGYDSNNILKQMPNLIGLIEK